MIEQIDPVKFSKQYLRKTTADVAPPDSQIRITGKIDTPFHLRNPGPGARCGQPSLTADRCTVGVQVTILSGHEDESSGEGDAVEDGFGREINVLYGLTR